MSGGNMARFVLGNPKAERVRRVRALLRAGARARERRFVVEGGQGVREAVAWRPDLVNDVYADRAGLERHAEIIEAAVKGGLHVHEVTPEVLALMSDTRTPQGIVAVASMLDVPLDDVLGREYARPPMFVLLAAVRDPGNAGTVLRGADAMGADAVLVGEASVDLYNPKVVRSTAGSLFHLPVVTGVSVAAALTRLREAGVASYAAAGGGEVSISDADLRRAHVWVLGNEAWGLPGEVQAACDEVVSIPLQRAESLNLAMAATICLYASATQRRDDGDGASN